MNTTLLTEYLTADDLAEALGVTLRTIKNYRDMRIGPPVTYIAGRPRYRRAAVEKWLLDRESVPLRKSHRNGFKIGKSA